MSTNSTDYNHCNPSKKPSICWGSEGNCQCLLLKVLQYRENLPDIFPAPRKREKVVATICYDDESYWIPKGNQKMPSAPKQASIFAMLLSI